MVSNNGAYLLTEDVSRANHKAFKIYTWGRQEKGAGLTVDQYGNYNTIDGRSVAVYPEHYGFTLFTNYGDVYSVSGTDAQADVQHLDMFLKVKM